MEEEKLIRRKKKALNGSNRRVLAEACNDLGSFYYKHNRYSDALDEYMSEAGICKELGLRMQWGTCNRKIGEMYMLLAEFDKALKYVEQSLAVAKELKNLVEEQRAMATLGRIYLLQGQTTTTDKDEAKTSLRAAEKAFRESYVLCKNLNGKINKHELMDMRARLLLNIGVLQDHLGNLDKAIDFINKAISICSSQDLYEVLHNCYTTEALLLCNKKKDHAKAFSCLNKALEVAKRLDDKVLKTCETLASKADILCEMSDYHSAKQVLFKAWKLKTPDKNESETIEANLRVVAAMCYTEELLTSTDPSDHETFKIHYEKLGDGACHLRNYADAAKYYLKMLDHAELAGECGKMLIPIYVSLYQTYKDMGAYNEALDYYEKEYELIKDVPKEAYTTMYNIAETLYLVKKPYEQIEKACFEARRAAREWNKRKYEVRVLKSLLKYQEEYGEMDKMEQTKDDLRYLGYDNLDNLENSEEEQSSAGGDDEDITHIGDDVCLEDLTDLSDTNEEEVKETKHETCKRGKGYTIKKNMKGETQLHVASISGNKLLVERLIAQGHPVNIRDNAGWLPLHEACIHGHVDVANILINNGANVNDRGGSNCDGITPLYDAASNGHLKVVQLLLEKGAILTLKTDIGETPLHVLQKWRTGTNLTKDEETIYNNICNKIQNSERNTTDILNRSESKTPVKSIKDIFPPRTSKMTSKIKELDTPGFKRRNIIDDDSDDDFDLSQILNEASCPSDDSNSSDGCKTKDKKKSSDVKEYRNTIEALRNRNGNDLLEVDVKKSEEKPALLDPEEIDDDWLDDDLGINENNNKKRKLDPLTTLAKPSNESINKDKTEEINNISESLIESNKNKSNVNRKSRVSDSDVMQGMNPNIVQAMNVIQPINIVQSSKNGRPVQTQILPLAAVKVQVEDKVLLISLKLDMINRLTISWLVEEVKSRYHKLIGVRPVFSLMTSDGAILSEDDPLSLVLSFPELKTCITNWKASPAEKRYLECCDALGTHFSHHQLDVDCGMSQNEEACLFQASPIRASPRACCPCPVSPPPAPPPLCTAPLSPTPGTSAEVQPEVTEDQDLDEGTLHFLGEAPKTDITMGPSVHKDIANRWQDILTKGLAKDVKEKLFKSYSVPNNCDLLLAPALNPEVKAALQDTLVKIDSALMDKQNQLGIALSALASATDMIISNETSKQKLLKPISDACRILCDSHFWETKTRRNFVISSININLKDALLVTKRGNFLFGENVSEKFKAAKTTQQSGDTLKPKYEKLKGIPKSPNKGHLKYNPQHRKTDNRPNNTRRAACPAFRPPPPPQTSGSSRRYTSPTRSPHRK